MYIVNARKNVLLFFYNKNRTARQKIRTKNKIIKKTRIKYGTISYVLYVRSMYNIYIYIYI